MGKTSSFGSGHARGNAHGQPREKRRKPPRPLDETTLRDLALSYVARFATTGAKLERYLARKIRERGLAEDVDGRTMELDVSALVISFVEAGYVDDDAYARARSRDLASRGYGGRRVDQVLWAAGVDEDVREAHAPGEAESREAAVLLAKKRRFGPFAPDSSDLDEQPGDMSAHRKRRDKQVAAMLRAGHSYTHAAFILDAASSDEIEEWLDEANADARSDADRDPQDDRV